MISDVIVGASLAFALAFTLARMLVPRLRARIEQPKHDFLDRLKVAESHAIGGDSTERP